MNFLWLSYLLLCTKTCRGSHLPHAKFSLQSILFLLGSAMGIMFGMFLFAFQIFSTWRCEAVIFPKFESACVHARPLRYLDMPYIFKAHAPCMCTCDVHARCDVTRFAYNVNHIIMMSSVSMFHSC